MKRRDIKYFNLQMEKKNELTKENVFIVTIQYLYTCRWGGNLVLGSRSLVIP